MSYETDEVIYDTLWNQGETIEFLDLDSAIQACEDIVAIDEMIKDIKAYLFDVTVLGLPKEFQLEVEEMKSLSYWVRTIDIKLDDDQFDIIRYIEDELVNDTVGIEITLFKGGERAATSIWELLEQAKEAVV